MPGKRKQVWWIVIRHSFFLKLSFATDGSDAGINHDKRLLINQSILTSPTPGNIQNFNTITLNEPEEILVLGETLSGENLCFGDALVQISIDLVSGGVPPNAYSIDGGANFSSSSVFTNLPAGNYQTVVRDANGCLGLGQLHVVTEPPVLQIGSYSQDDITSCFDALEGEISIGGAGGTPPYS